ncbi:hypothetical protein [Mycetocola sp. 2940]|uniref:hypothetical protein n=1 Tax=Mycetocola sp. 2940 TaxID=3156452 RepID=UPI00339926E1
MDRVGALSGAAYVILANVGNTLGQDASLSESATGEEVLESYARLADDVGRQLGLSIEMLGLATWMIFVGYVYSRTRGAGWLAPAALVAGTISIAVKFASFAPVISIYLLRGDMEPGTASMLANLNLVSFMIDTLPAGLFVACGAAAAMASGALGRVLGWAGVVCGVIAAGAAVVIGIRIEGSFAPSFLLVMVWVFAVSIRWGFARSRAKAAVTGAD